MSEHIPSKTMSLEEAYEAGWSVACDWARRDDMLADVGSPAYLIDMNIALGPKSDRGSHETCETAFTCRTCGTNRIVHLPGVGMR